jgi:hypothetical protein
VKAFVAVVALASLLATPVSAQDSPTGTYSGSIVAQSFGADFNVGLTIVITSVDDGRVKGVATMGGRACAGEYPFEGSLKGNELAIRSTVKGGRAGDCTFGMRGTLNGNTITGKIGQYPLQLSK